MTLPFTPYALVYCATAILSTALASVSWRRRAIAGARTFTLFLLAVAEWTFVSAFEITAVGIPAKVFWSKVAYIGTLSSPILFLIFVVQYTRRSKWLTRQNMMLLWVIPLVTFAVATTNEWHGAVWNRFTLTEGNILIYGHGAWFWVQVGYSYLMVSLGILFLLKRFVQHRGAYQKQAGMLILASLFPVAGGAIYVAGASPVPGLELTSISLALTGGVIAWSIFRFQLLDLVPVARDALVESMSDGLLVLNDQDYIVDINPAARRLIGFDASIIGHPVKQVWDSIRFSDVSSEIHSEVLLTQDPPRWLEVQSSDILDPDDGRTGRLVTLRDISVRKKMETALQELNADLERLVEERTAKLQTTIGELENEIAERKRAEESLRTMEQMLAGRVADQSRLLTGLYEIILVGGQSLSIHELEDQALAKFIVVLKGDAGCIHELDADHSTLRLNVQRGLSPEAQTQFEALPAAWLLGDRIPRNVTDLAADPSAPPSVRSSRFGAYLGIPTSVLGRVTGSLSIFWNHPRSFSVEEIALFNAMADQLGIIIENAKLRDRGEQAAAMKERRRLARDLHDSVTQSLHSLVLSTETASHRLKQGKLDLLEASLAQQADSARQAVKEMRLLLFEMRLATLDEVNLVEALQTRLEMVEKRAGVHVQFDVAPIANLPKAWEKELYCIAMEALNNSLKHSRATKLSVRLEALDHYLELEIVDNGIGIEPHMTKLGGMGLGSMAERAERLGGKLTIASAPDAGTRIHLCVEEAE